MCPYLEDLELPEPEDVESKLSVDPSPLAPGGFSRSWPPEESSPLPVTSQATRDVPLPPAMPQEWSSLCHRPLCPPPEQLCDHPSAGALNCFIFSVGPCHPTDLSLGNAAPLFQPNEHYPVLLAPSPCVVAFCFSSLETSITHLGQLSLCQVGVHCVMDTDVLDYSFCF